MKVTIVAHTRFNGEVAEELTGMEQPWDGTAEDLSEFAGRACYQSWTRPNPHTASVAGYINHILDVQHFSVLEHGTATMYVEHVSRSLTHELVRHRHLSYSQLSQRFVVINPDVMERTTADFVVPPLLRGEEAAEKILLDLWDRAIDAYGELEEEATRILLRQGVVSGTALKKRAREAARAVLPNMTPTAIVVTGNHRSWRHFIELRATEHADAEICELAVEVFKLLRDLTPAIYQDKALGHGYDGREIVVAV